HWSDMLAVLPEHWNRGVGQRLKQHQREEALRLGVETIYWTFDPLESKNAYLNLSRLGGVASEYWRDAYGQTDSPLHRGIGTDRLVIEWRIASPRVVQRLAGDRPAPTFADIEPLPAVNDVRPAAHGLESTEPDLGLAAERVRLVIPAEIQELKTASPALAAEWRRITRAVFETYLGKGYQAVELVQQDDRSHYVLERSRAALDW